MRPKITSIDDCVRLATQKGGTCISKEYIDSQVKLEWKCSKGHSWEATFYNIRNGHWCPYCAKCTKHTIEDCVDLAKQKHGKCLTAQYTNNNTKIEWECQKRHRWVASFNAISSGKWCPECSRYTLDDCKGFAENKGGRCLSREYPGMTSKMEWECKYKHKWSASFNNVKNNGTWCPECYGWKTQALLKEICKDIFSTTILSCFKGFDWLKTNKNGRQEIDIWIPEIKLAIEYDGKQHFEPLECFGGENGLKNTKRLDKIKNKKIKQHSEDVKYFVRFNYKEKITREYVLEKLMKNGVKI